MCFVYLSTTLPFIIVVVVVVVCNRIRQLTATSVYTPVLFLLLLFSVFLTLNADIYDV